MSRTYFVNAEGNRVPDRAGAQYVLKTTVIDEVPQYAQDALKSTIRKGLDTFCQGGIDASMVDDAFGDSETLGEDQEVLQLFALTRKSQVPVGFVLGRYLPDSNSYYIDLICGYTSDIQLRRVGLPKLPIGKILLQQAEDQARALGFTKMKLSALSYVINYYRRYGYRHLKEGESVESAEVAAAAEELAKFRFRSDADFDRAFIVGYAELATNELVGSEADRRARMDHLATRLTDYFSDEGIKFRVEGGDVVAYDPDDEVNMELTTLVQEGKKYVPMVHALMQLRIAGFSAKDPKRPTLRKALEKWDDGEGWTPAAVDLGFGMTKHLGAAGGGKRKKMRKTRRGAGRRRVSKTRRQMRVRKSKNHKSTVRHRVRKH